MVLSVGSRIKAARKFRGITGQDFAQRLGVTQANVSRWESGVRVVSSERLQQMATILQVPLYFLKGENILIGKVGRQYPGTWYTGRFQKLRG